MKAAGASEEPAGRFNLLRARIMPGQGCNACADFIAHKPFAGPAR